ncbi:hypothetical protein ACLK1S_21260 [Escherichia coli]
MLCAIVSWSAGYVQTVPVVARTRQVYYLSMKFLIGRTLSNAMLSLGIYEDVQGALEAMGLNLEELIDEENDPGLGNGGLDVGGLLP